MGHGLRYGEKGMEFFKCQNCPERNKNSTKTGNFKVKRYFNNIQLQCLYCKAKYIIPMKNLCYHCNNLGETIIYTKEEYIKIKQPKTIEK